MVVTETHYDFVVVGAGIQGLCAAHTFLSIDPSLSLLIIDNNSSVGGTWSQEKVYPGLRANNLQGYFEFTDYPMLDAHVDVKPQGLISGQAVSDYLQGYAERFDLIRRIRFNTQVEHATRIDDNKDTSSWELSLTNKVESSEEKSSSITCSKLIVATGQTSRPSYPAFANKDSFQKPIIHTADLGLTGTGFLQDPSVANVTVLGGGKSAHDAVYRFASAGKKVTWIIRKSGRGAFWMAKSFPQLGPFKLWLENLLMSRPLSWFAACPWSTGDGFGKIRYLLHSTTGGRWISRNYFNNMGKSTLEQSGILKRASTQPLVPKESMMWYGGQAAILHYDEDFYDLIEDKGVKTINSDIDRLDKSTVLLSDGQKVSTDVLICATGYQRGPSFPIFPVSKQATWGIPVEPSVEEAKAFAALDTKADAELFSRFPELQMGPVYPDQYPKLTPWRLWRFIAPPPQAASTKRDLAFLNTVETYQNVLKSELMSLWTYAYLNNQLSINPESEDQALYESSLWSRFGKWRCPMGSQGMTCDTLHDNLPYYDTLLTDLGMNSWRKGWGLLGEIFGGWYRVKDYEGIVTEWVAKNERVPHPAN